MILFELIIAGVFGGLARAFYGALKAAGRGQTIHIWYFFITVLIGGIIGGVIGALFSTGKTVSALAGYVGSDLIETMAAGVLPKSIVLNKKELRGKK